MEGWANWIVTLVLALVLGAPAPTTTPVVPATRNAAIVGEWSPPVDVGVVGIHAVLLRTGHVLLWGLPQPGSDARLLNPATGTVTDVPIPFEVNMFCAGHSVLADGRVLLFGGTVGNPPEHYKGTTTILFFDPITARWSTGGALAARRWYPAGVQLDNGKTLIVTGDSSKDVLEKTAEMYDAGAGTSALLPGSANSKSDPYAHLFLVGSGKVFRAGPNPAGRFFHGGTNSWSARSASMNFGWRFGGGAVLLPGLRVLTAGGVDTTLATKEKGEPATPTAEIINLNDPSPAWRYTGSMRFARAHASFVTLPDETVLAVGGTQVQGVKDLVHAAELYQAETGAWSVMASQAADRAYHSTALLLPDGRVLSAGMNAGRTGTTVDYFSPPYLFRGPRPVIVSSPSSVRHGQTFEILTPQGARITKLALIRPGASTHSWNPDQRYVRLSFTRGFGKVTATVPQSRADVPPGYYMLFVVNDRGVPSIAPFIQIG